MKIIRIGVLLVFLIAKTTAFGLYHINAEEMSEINSSESIEESSMEEIDNSVETQNDIESKNSKLDCNLDADLLAEIAGYQEAVDSIINYIVSGEHKGVTFNTLMNFVDTFGPRMVRP